MAEWGRIAEDFLGTDFSGTPSGDLEARMEERWGDIQNQLSSEQFGQMEHETDVMGYGNPLTGDEIVRAGLDSEVHTDWASPRSQSVSPFVAGLEYDRTGYGDTVVEMNPAYFDYNQTLAGNTTPDWARLAGESIGLLEPTPYKVDPQYNQDVWRHEYSHAGLDKYRQIDPEGYFSLDERITGALNPNITSSITSLDKAYALPRSVDAEEMFNRWRDFITSEGESSVNAAWRYLDDDQYSPNWGEIGGIYDDINESLRAERGGN